MQAEKECSTANSSTPQQAVLARGVKLDATAARKKFWINLWDFLVPMLGSILTVPYLMKYGLSWIDIGNFAFFYVFVGVGVGLGFHRGFTHLSFRGAAWFEFLLILGGSMSFQGGVLNWVADHRRHHQFADEPADPYSPVASFRGRLTNKWKGLYHAHFAWMFDPTTTDHQCFCPDLLKRPMVVFFHQWYLLMCLLALLLPGLAGYALGGWQHAMGGVLIAGCFRAMISQQIAWAVNSLGHCYGAQDASQRDSSRNNFWLAMLTFGEGWHNNHHAKPWSAFNDWKWYQLDIIAHGIRVLYRLGIITKVVGTEGTINKKI